MARSKRWTVGFLGVALLVVLAQRVRAQAATLPRERLVEAAEAILEAAPRYPESEARLKRLAIELDRTVTTSGGEPLFLDSCRLAPKPLSAQSFLRAKEAVAELVSLTHRARRIGSEETPAPSLVRLAKEVRDEVLEAYFLVADVSIQEARARGGNPANLLGAEKDLSQGLIALERGNFQNALARFGESWLTSQQSFSRPVENGDAPLVNILTPRQGNVLAGTRPIPGRDLPPTLVNVTGMVQDLVLGIVNDDDVDVFVNGKPAAVVNRSYQVNGVPLRNGLNALLAVAIDADGNAGFGCVTVVVDPSPRRRIQSLRGNDQLGMIGTSLPMPLVAGVVDEHDQAVSGATVVFRIVQGDGSIGPSGERIVAVTTDASGEATVPFQLGSRAGVGLHRVRATATGYDGEAFFCATATGAAPQSINPVTGDTQTGIVSTDLPRPLVAFVTDAGQNPVQGVDVTFRVMEGGGLVNGLSEIIVPTNSDGRANALATLGPDPGLDNNVIEASFAGLTREPATFRASAFVLGPPEDTRIAGVVLDNQSQPVPGVTLSIHGGPPFAQADAQGQFLLTGVPVGHVVLEADGSTATRPGVWAGLLFELNCIAGAVNTLPKPIYLLPLDIEHGKIVGGPSDETITIPAVEGFSLRVLAGSATFPDGSRTGLVSVTPVTADKIPMPPGSGMQPRVIVTIQPDGARFSPPAPVTYPNVDGAPPGAVMEMFSFDHELGEFVSIGTGTVSQDGMVVASDPGFGIVKGGWHCSAPQSEAGAAAPIAAEISTSAPVILCLGGDATIRATGTPPRDARFTWTISDSSIAGISPSSGTPNPSSGACDTIVSPASGGRATVTLTVTCISTGASDSAEIEVLVVEPSLKSITFTSDHGLLRDNSANYEPTGDLFDEPEWLDSGTNSPISHSMNTEVSVNLEIEVNPEELDATQFSIAGTGPLGFNFEESVTLVGGRNMVSLASTDRIESKIMVDDVSIRWQVAMDKTPCLDMTTGPHRVYVTIGTPRDTGDPRYLVTENRMARAVGQAGAADSLDPHEIVRVVIQSQGDFDLDAAQENAWLVPDNGGDCQSIVRFADKVARMVNVPGTLAHRNIYAIETSPAVAIEVPGTHGGLNEDIRVHSNGAWTLALIDGGGGCNAFEATARFSFDGVTKYYAGGTTGVFDNPDDVLSVFATLSWVDFINGVCTVQEVVHAY